MQVHRPRPHVFEKQAFSPAGVGDHHVGLKTALAQSLEHPQRALGADEFGLKVLQVWPGRCGWQLPRQRVGVQLQAQRAQGRRIARVPADPMHLVAQREQVADQVGELPWKVVVHKQELGQTGCAGHHAPTICSCRGRQCDSA